MWKKISLTVAPVCLLLGTVNAIMVMKQHEAHNLEHSHEIDRPPYHYQKIRSKVFFIYSYL